jgi:hypothetical protein
MNPISDWSKISIWGNVRRFLTQMNFISGWGTWIERFDSEFFKECFDSIPFYKDTNFEIYKILWSKNQRFVPYTIWKEEQKWTMILNYILYLIIQKIIM